jgi:hypothetical protein
VPNFSRRETLRGRAHALRVKADAYLAGLKDRQVKEFITASVIYPLDSVEEFWLAERATWPEYEAVWLHNTETVLGLAERMFANYETLFAKYMRSGPEQIRVEPEGV